MKTASLHKINMTSQNKQLRKIKKYTWSWSEMNKYMWNHKVSHAGCSELSSIFLFCVGLNSDGNSNDGGQVPSHWGPGHSWNIFIQVTVPPGSWLAQSGGVMWRLQRHLNNFIRWATSGSSRRQIFVFSVTLGSRWSWARTMKVQWWLKQALSSSSETPKAPLGLL